MVLNFLNIISFSFFENLSATCGIFVVGVLRYKMF